MQTLMGLMVFYQGKLGKAFRVAAPLISIRLRAYVLSLLLFIPYGYLFLASDPLREFPAKIHTRYFVV